MLKKEYVDLIQSDCQFFNPKLKDISESLKYSSHVYNIIACCIANHKLSYEDKIRCFNEFHSKYTDQELENNKLLNVIDYVINFAKSKGAEGREYVQYICDYLDDQDGTIFNAIAKQDVYPEFKGFKNCRDYAYYQGLLEYIRSEDMAEQDRVKCILHEWHDNIIDTETAYNNILFTNNMFESNVNAQLNYVTQKENMYDLVGRMCKDLYQDSA